MNDKQEQHARSAECSRISDRCQHSGTAFSIASTIGKLQHCSTPYTRKDGAGWSQKQEEVGTTYGG